MSSNPTSAGLPPAARQLPRADLAALVRGTGAFDSPINNPTTMVYTKELSVAGLMAGLATGWLSDRIGGARVTFWNFAVMIVGVWLALHFLPTPGGEGATDNLTLPRRIAPARATRKMPPFSRPFLRLLRRQTSFSPA